VSVVVVVSKVEAEGVGDGARLYVGGGSEGILVVGFEERAVAEEDL